MEYVSLRIFLPDRFTKMQDKTRNLPEYSTKGSAGGKLSIHLRGLSSGSVIFGGDLVVIPGIFIALCNRQGLCIFCVGKNHVYILIPPVAKQDADPNRDFDLISNVGDVPIEYLLYTIYDPNGTLAIRDILDQDIERVRVKSGNGVRGT